MQNLIPGAWGHPSLEFSVFDELSPLIASSETLVVVSGTGQRLLNAKFPGQKINTLLLPKGEPDLENFKISHTQRLAGIENVIALGGGSVIDSTKMLLVGYQFPEVLGAISAGEIPLVINANRLGVKWIAIPTTIGSGAEVSSSAIVGVRGTKIPVVGPSLRPQKIVLDPSLVSAEPSKNVSGLIDLVAHSFESLLSRKPSKLLEFLAVQNISLVCEVSESNNFSEADILRLQVAGIQAGWCQDHRLVSIPHSIAHQFPKGKHGERVGLFLMPFIEQLSDVFPGEADRVQKLLSPAGLSMQMVSSCIRGLLLKTFQPDALEAKFALTEEAAMKALSDPTLRLSSLPLSHESIMAFRFPEVS